MSATSGRQEHVLIVDDEEGIRHGLQRLFLKEGYVVDAVDGVTAARHAMQTGTVDVAVVDIRLKNGKSGIDLVHEIRSVEPDAVVIVVTGYGSIDTAIAAMKEGAAEYIVKPIDNIKLLDSVSKNLQLRALKQENSFLRSELYNRNRGSQEFITRNRAISFVLDKADKIKNSPVTALITGESGTGKEVLARHIHFTSNRKDARFVSINCAALSESLLLSELFGHEKGSFTGAIERKAGKFEIADGGTLFLDEIGDMPPDIQAKLLRVLEENAFERVGGTRRISVDVRIVAATNKNLQELIAAGKFREDLYYRINIVSFHLPPLRERKEDIPLLVDHFIRKYNEKYKKAVEGICAELTVALESYNWPGNVRELENLFNQAVLLSEGPVLRQEGFFKSMYGAADSVSGENAETSASTSGVEDGVEDAAPSSTLKEYLSQVIEDNERTFIAKSLERNGYNKSKTARELNVTRKTLARKISRYRIRPSA